MSKKEDDDSKEWKYEGMENEWDSFDRRMIRYMRKKLDVIGEKMWLGEIGSVFAMKQGDYEAHCDEVMRAIYCMDPSEARKLKNDLAEFEDPDWQYAWLARQFVLMGDYIESHSKGQAEIEMINYSGDMREIRKHLYKQFGSGSGGNIHEKELEFDRGLPEKGKAAFPPGCDMGEKLRQLESRRLYFMRMAGSAEKRKTYTYCQETKLVRIVLEHVNKSEYGDCIKRVLEAVKFKKMVAKAVSGESSDDESGVPDNHERSFSDDWLPSWKLLKAALLEEWNTKSTQGAVNNKGKNVLPIAMGAVKSFTCWGCGGPHKKGDPECKAGKFDVHQSAPAVYKDRMNKKRKAEKVKAEKDGGNKSPKKKGKANEKEKKPCRAFNFGKGNCRYGDKCKFSHEKKKEDYKAGEFSPQQEKIVSAMVASAVKKTAALISKKNKKKGEKKMTIAEDSDNESVDYAAIMASICLAPIKNTIPREIVTKNGTIVMAVNLHDVNNNCGIDSDAGISISTLKEDFPLWIDESDRARASIATPTGITGGTPGIGGRGPMVVKAKSGEYLIDPDAVYLKPAKDQPNFRVMATQRLKTNGVRIVGCFKGTDTDVLQDRVSKRVINLSEDGAKDTKILVLETIACPSFTNISEMRKVVNDIRKRNRSAMYVMEEEGAESHNDENANEIDEGTSILAFNVAKCSEEERSRLYSRRFGYCNPELLLKMNKDADFGSLPKFGKLNEDNHVMDLTKFKKKAHTRTDPDISMGKPPWWKVYYDGYGGGKSMGAESYEGAIGGYLFVCSSTGDVHHKLYASHEQFPAALFQFLVHVESEGHRCHELYCDTFSSNISAEVEEVAGLFQVKVVPVSSGTPQEVSFVESQVRIIGARSRAMLLGAPHLPSWCWALADKFAVTVGRQLPQSTRQWKSAAFLNSGKVPDWRSLCIHVFGSPCLYAPTDGPVHKRAEKTLEGYYVGIQHPMVLILRKHDMKLISCSSKKFVCHESVYTLPLNCSSSTLKRHILQTDLVAESQSITEKNADKDSVTPTHIQSTKSIYSHTIPVPNTSGPIHLRAPTKLDDSAQSQSPSQGEGVVSPEHLAYTNDLATGLKDLKQRVEKQVEDPGIRKKIIDSLTKASESVANVIEQGQLKVGKGEKNKISTSNVVLGKRTRSKVDGLNESEKPSKECERKRQKIYDKIKFQPGDAVSVSSKIFDGDSPGSYSKVNPDRQKGTIIKIFKKKRVAQVEWIDGSKNIVKLRDMRIEKIKVNAAFFVTMMVTEALKPSRDSIEKQHWPRDFFHALVSPEWREWVLAVKKEVESWLTFNAYTEIPFGKRKVGSSIVPLGELYTRKRDGAFKFRQYLMGNLLKKGKDYDETFSSCISWDGIRWFAAIACVTGKMIKGLDAVTGFLQAKEQFDLYAFLPSHARYSDLSLEELASVRMNLLKLIEKEGEEGLRKFAAAHKKESRANPKSCYQLNSSIYGAPSANHEFEMLFQNVHINKCGLTLSEVEPSLYVKIQVDEKDEVIGWLLMTIWTDDVRYIGTDNCIKEYEQEVQKHVKVKFLDIPGEFVGTEFHQNLELGICELKSPKYWESALERLAKYFPKGVKERWNPLSIYDEKRMMEEVSDEEFEEAKHLEYRELCGIISYPASCTKLEMRYAVSICGRHRSKWGKKQFEIMLKVFEYGYTTRQMGIIYSKGLDSHGDNTLYCYADSGHSLPRSYGCTIAMMNGAALSLSAKRHTLTASSTCHDEIIEFAIAVNRMIGFRNIMCEMGLEQGDATTIYQDNEAAIHLAMNRGALSKQSRHIDRKILAARNKIEDHEVKPKYISTERMVADIGTKALSDDQFIYLRDQLNGYSLVKLNHPDYRLPEYVSKRK
jgi:hypothetical protein